MEWHARYLQQAQWTRDLRRYLFEKAGLAGARRVLEVGCGTGAILETLESPAGIHGLDIDRAALARCRLSAPHARLACGDALSLPYAVGAFDIVYCHYLLLWVGDPLRALGEMKRATRPGGNVLALAEPDYTARLDQPEPLAILGQWQTEALKRQGADPSLGGRLADLFFRTGIEIVETGPIAAAERRPSAEERQMEWAVIESDLEGVISSDDIRKMKERDEAAWVRGEHRLHVPTYFAWGKV
jgi:ubiquinone/menaquinone biosynthesis C-methylase UbiE